MSKLKWFLFFVLLMSMLTACGQAVAPVEEAGAIDPGDTQGDSQAAASVEEAGPPSQYSEAPILAEQVAAGELPSVEERLPVNPYVVGQGTLVDTEDLQIQIGQYGEIMQLAQESPNGDPHIFIGMNEPLIWAYDGFEYEKGIAGNVAESYEVNDDNTEFTFHLRAGLKWSDGVPVTTEDVRFAFEDVLYNEELTPAFPTYLRSGFSGSGNPATFEVIDDLTFKIIFDKPYGSFLAQLAIGGWRSYTDVLKPKHYLQQFHIKYTPIEELRPMMEAESIAEEQWYNLFNAKQMAGSLWRATNEAGIGHPVLTPWVIQKVDSGVFTFARNPYYFKVDIEGNQLPYIDGIRSHIVGDKETLTARALMGEFDYLGERASLKKLPLMKEAELEGRVKVYIPRMHRTPIGFHLNLTYDDPIWRQVTSDVRFRQALSLAINRPEILKTFYLDQFANLPTDANHSEFDVAKANALLDEIGLDQRDDEGFRLGPDGEEFIIRFEMSDFSEDHLPMSELIAEYWKDVGVHTTVKKIEGGLRSQREDANELLASGIWPVVDMWHYAAWFDYLPEDFGPTWRQWYNTQGEAGEEPPQEIKTLYDTHEAIMTARSGSEESLAAIQDVLRMHRENQWYFIPVERSHYATFFSPRIQNVPTGISDGLGIIVMHSMEQWYIDE